MKVLITGASGFLGHALLAKFSADHDVVGCFNSRPIEGAVAVREKLDFTDAAQCSSILEQHLPEVIVHAGAMTQTSDCEQYPDLAQRVNVGGTQNLLDAAKELPNAPHFIYVSTDLVFDGRTGNYSEDDSTNPIMIYGRTKLAAEELVKSYPGQFAIVRSSLIYGLLNRDNPSFLDWMFRSIESGTGKLFEDEYRTPVFVEDICTAIERIAAAKHTGTFHIAGPTRLSRYEFGLLAADAFAIARNKVKAGRLSDTKLSAPRPADVSLDISKARRVLDYSPLSPREALRIIAGD